MLRAQLLQCRANLRDSRQLSVWITDNAALPYQLSANFELGFNQNNDLASSSVLRKSSGQYRREHQCCRDKRDVHRHEVDGFTNVAFCEIARVRFLKQPYAGVLPKSEIHLAVAGVNRNDAGNTVLQQAICESSGGCAYIHAGFARDVDLPVLKRSFKLESATADVLQIGIEQADRAIQINLCARLLDLLLIHQHFAGKDKCLRTLARSNESAVSDQPIEPNFQDKFVPNLSRKCQHSL